MDIKSPFFVIPEFISPLLCEELIDLCDFTVPDQNIEGHDIKSTKTKESAEAIVYNKLLQILPNLQKYYNFSYKGTEPMLFEWFPEGSKGEMGAENSNFVRGQWLRTRQRDITGILFLCDYNDQLPFERDYEVYGGKLEFPQHAFGFNPTRGTLVFFPSDPHFINVTANIHTGDLYQVRIQIAANEPLLYDPQQFPGNYTTWFNSLL